MTEPSLLVRSMIVVGVANTVGKEEALKLLDSIPVPVDSIGDAGIITMLPKMVRKKLPLFLHLFSFAKTDTLTYS